MDEYVVSLTVTVAVCTLATMLAPGDRGLGKYTRLIASLCILCVAISPVSSFFQNVYSINFDMAIPDAEKNNEYELENVYLNMLTAASEADLSVKIEDMICREIDASEEDIEVFAELYEVDGEGKIKKLTVMLSGKAIFTDPQMIREYLLSLFECECEIVYG